MEILEKTNIKLAHGQAVCLKIKVTPKSGKCEIAGTMADGTIKIKLKSAPENNKANEELIILLSKTFNIPGEKIIILTGKKAKRKIIEIRP